MVVEPQSLQSLSAEELRELTTRLMTQLRHQSALLDKLTHENALLKRMKFAAQSERFNPEQKSLLEDEIEADLAAVATEIDALQEAQAPAKVEEKKVPKRAPLPANLPRREIRHEPKSTLCPCGCQMKRVGEDVAEKLDYVPGVFTVERHIRGKWACAKCETITQVPVDPHVIDKGIPTTGLLAQVLVAKFLDHLPLYRQERIFERAGLAIARSTLAQWVGECGVQLQPLVDALTADPYRIACLRGGPDEAVRLAMVNLVDRDLLTEAKGSALRSTLKAEPAQQRRRLDRVILERCQVSPMTPDEVLADRSVHSTASELETELQQRGIKLWRDGDRLRFDAPPGAMTPALQERLRLHKPELLALVPARQDQAAAAARAATHSWTRASSTFVAIRTSGPPSASPDRPRRRGARAGSP